ncbi:MAG TPA: EAL domain-containing protein, partial [Noviherbaspirillum sp.]|nr:EAL domain-containing protein [Noviherbaspirillum sp.]
EVGPTHPLTLALDDMRREGAAIRQLTLAPLSEATLGTYLGAMLQCERDAAAPLARLIYQKTAGNPFFVSQFITAVVEERMIAYDAAARTWRWDLHRISAKGYTDNVAELMIDKLARLPAPAQAALQWLACLGSSAPEAMLVTLCGQPEEKTQAALSAAVRAGLILHTPGTIRFLHDRVREAAYLSIPAASRAALHLQIGRLLLAGKTQAQIEEAVFTIVDHFNRGADSITDANERALLCHLNFLAGKKAKASIAYSSARSFLDRAMALLPADAWRTLYQNTFALMLALSECEYLAGNLERAEQLADLILANAQSRRDRAHVYLLRLQLYQMGGRFDDALNIMLEAAQLFDMRFPLTVPEVEAATEAEMRDISAYLQGRRIADIANAALLDDADMGMAIAFLVEAFPVAYLIRPDYFTLIIARAVKLSLHYGNSEDACKAYSVYGCTLAALTNDISAGIEFSEMALELNRKLHGRRRTGRMLMMHACGISPLKNAIANVVPTMDQALAACIESGDLVYANYVAMAYFWFMLQKGDTLDEIWHTAHRHGEFVRQSHNETVYHAIRFQQQLVTSLKGQAPAPASMDDADFDERAAWSAMEKAGFGLGIENTYILKQISAFFYGDYAGALAAAQQAAKVSNKRLKRIYTESFHHSYLGLTLAALYPQAPAAEQRQFAAMLAEELARHKLWADHCPQNFLNCYALLGAEIARIEGREHDAERLYEQAIHSARENGFIQNEATAFELASAFYRARVFELIADTYLREARAGYTRWGADGKVAQLDARYPQLHTQPASASMLAEGCAVVPLDVLSVTKASQAISSRIVLNELVDTLLHIVLENAGAQTGCLLLCGSEGLEVAAEATVDQGVVQMRFYDRQAPDEASLPTAILNYVRRSREQVLLPDVAQAHPFSTDAYFTHHHPKSVLCLPILRQDALIGLLYLENNLVTHAFAPERVTVLNLLAAQAAISLENAQFYANLQQENRERKRAEDALQKKEARIRRLVDANIIGVYFADLSGGISEANDAFLQLTGYSRQDLRSGAMRWTDMTPPAWRARDEQAINELKKTGIATPYEKEYIREDGSRVPVLIGSAIIEGTSDQGVGFVLDLSARKQAEERIRHMAHHDALTELPNRTLLQDRINQAIAYAHRNQRKVGILFIDLDYFKNINDSLGHYIGDVVLQMTAIRLQNCLREGDSVARLGGDEFVLCLSLLNDSSDATRVAQKALDTLAQPFIVEGHELHISGSIGISLYPDDGTDVKTLMRTADTAMYHAKETGRGHFQFFTEALNDVAQQRLEVNNQLRYALAHNEFVLHYQPQVDMESGTIFSVEALLRWQPPGTQPISCGAFIANAEESGLIVPIGEWALRQACKQLKIWRDAGHTELKVAVNLSPRQLEQANFCSLIEQILDEAEIPATTLELEITEGVLMPPNERNLATLTQLSGMGIQLSVDDFGTGYSSLSYLQRFPVHALKIDQSFVRDIGKDQNDIALITAIIAMAASLHRKVLAEGVETLQQVQFLRAHGCLAAQGFYYSKAVPANALTELLRSNSKLKTV